MQDMFNIFRTDTYTVIINGDHNKAILLKRLDAYFHTEINLAFLPFFFKSVYGVIDYILEHLFKLVHISGNSGLSRIRRKTQFYQFILAPRRNHQQYILYAFIEMNNGRNIALVST